MSGNVVRRGTRVAEGAPVIGACGFRAVDATHGAAVAPGTEVPGWLHGARVPAVTGGGTVDLFACWECVVGGGAVALGSRSQLNREPNGKCCTTGNLESTSALYILIMPYRARLV